MHLYTSSGVNIDSGNEFVKNIRVLTDKTSRPEVIGSIGSFGGLFDIAPLIKKYENPVLVSSTDGVGTKLLIAQATKNHKTIGIDLVAMCANDILVHGAEPLFFLDYIAVGKLDQNIAFEIVSGISEGCIQSGMSLVGGETAELPKMYNEDKYDLAGFAVGIAEKTKILPSSNICAGDIIVGLKSSGLHSNGYSLILKMIEEFKIDYSNITPFGNQTWGELLLEPTKIYVKTVLPLVHLLKGIAHITGGGILGNLPRILPKGTNAVIKQDSWNMPEIFNYISNAYKVDKAELFNVYNCGIGMILVVDKKNLDEIIYVLGDEASIIGNIEYGINSEPSVLLN